MKLKKICCVLFLCAVSTLYAQDPFIEKMGEIVFKIIRTPVVINNEEQEDPIVVEPTDPVEQPAKRPFVQWGSIGIVNGARSGNYAGVTWKDGFADNLVINMGVGNGGTFVADKHFAQFPVTIKQDVTIMGQLFSTEAQDSFQANKGIGFQTSVYYLFLNKAFENAEYLRWHIGAGAYFGGGTFGIRTGAEAIAGIAWYPQKIWQKSPPLEIFAEYSLSVGVAFAGSEIITQQETIESQNLEVAIQNPIFDVGYLGWNIGIRWIF